MKNVSVLVAIGVAQTGYRQILAVSEGAKEDKVSWTTFLRELKERGLKAVKLFVSDKCLGLVENRIVVWNLIEDWWLSFYVRISGNRKLLCANIAFHVLQPLLDPGDEVAVYHFLQLLELNSDMSVLIAIQS